MIFRQLTWNVATAFVVAGVLASCAPSEDGVIFGLVAVSKVGDSGDPFAAQSGITSVAVFESLIASDATPPELDTCTIYDGSFDGIFDGEGEGDNPTEYRDPGAPGVITAGSHSAELVPQSLGIGFAFIQTPQFIPAVPAGSFAEISFPGGADLPAFSGAIEILDPPAFSSPIIEASPTGNTVEIDFTQDLDLRWDASVPGERFSVSISVRDLDDNSVTGLCECALVDDGAFTIPAGLLEQLGYNPEGNFVYNFDANRTLNNLIGITANDGTPGSILMDATASTFANNLPF